MLPPNTPLQPTASGARDRGFFDTSCTARAERSAAAERQHVGRRGETNGWGGTDDG